MDAAAIQVEPREAKSATRTRVLLFILLASGAAFMFVPWSPSVREQIAAEPRPVPNEVTDVTAADILERMTNAYAACRIYSDSGATLTTFRGRSEHESQRRFETYFARGDGFRFEYTEVPQGTLLHRLIAGEARMVIWGDERNAHFWWSIENTMSSESSMMMALAGAAGVSGGTSTRIPLMLLPESISSRRFTDCKWLPTVAVESVGRHICFKLHTDAGPRDTAIWVDRESYLLRRVLDKSVIRDDLQVEQVTVYEPSIETPIPPAMFTFDPAK